MNGAAQVHRVVAPRDKRPTPRNRRRRQHLRHIRPMTCEQQFTLIEEARAARRTAQQAAEAADAQMLTVPPKRGRAYGNG
jgi:hypothetical protein